MLFGSSKAYLLPSSEPAAKRNKPNEIGGLKDGWRASLYGRHRSTVSLASSTDFDAPDIDLQEVEFGVDESKEVLEAQRNAKTHKEKGKSKVCDCCSFVHS